jgi:Spy/CpxP family protein refolding chaperone
MNRRLIFVSTFSVVLMMSMVAFGQPGGGPGGRGGRMGGMGGMMMGSSFFLRQEAVQKELSLTDEQKEKLKEAMPAGRGPGGGGANLRDMSEEERAKAMEERAKQAAEAEKKIADILDDKQEARLKQIRLQVTGARAIIMNQDVAKELGITEEQTTKIREAMTALREEMQGGGGGGPGAFAAMAEKGNAKVMEILTDEQKAKYKEMLGEPFDVSQIPMGFGGGAGGAGGGRRGGRGN